VAIALWESGLVCLNMSSVFWSHHFVIWARPNMFLQKPLHERPSWCKMLHKPRKAITWFDGEVERCCCCSMHFVIV
jgi:hypothetical protein